MDFSRLWHTLRLFLIKTGRGRANYIKKHNVFYGMGENCSVQFRKLPLYAKLIRFHNNVHIASNVTFVTHDIVHVVFNKKNNSTDHLEKIGCIEIQDNVFIGTNVTILYDVKIGSNVVVGAGSLVNKDLPSNGVYAGVPAKYICSFDELEQRRGFDDSIKRFKDHKFDEIWKNFEEKHYK